MNIKKTILLTTGLSTLLLAGCSSTSVNRCPIDQDGYPKCKSMEQVFDHALNEDGDNLSVIPKTYTEDEDLANAQKQTSSSQGQSFTRPVTQLKQANNLEHPYQAKPVYVPEKVHRLWFAPWQDSAKNLRSAEMVYFTTKGYWNYGSMNKAGSIGSAMLEPLAPTELGFSPDFTSQDDNVKNGHVQPEVTILGN